MKTPLLLVNFKAYREAVGGAGLTLARLCERVSEASGQAIAVAPGLADLSFVASQVEIPVLAQHADNVPAGSFTGWLPPESIQAAAATGTLLNHAEHRIEVSSLETLIRRCEVLGLETVVCADTLAMARAAAALRPTFVAIEPPELIGGEVSVTNADPAIVSGAVEAVRAVDTGVQVLCGAGVKTGADAAKALALGTQGVLLSSGVVKAKEPQAVLTDLVSGLG